MKKIAILIAIVVIGVSGFLCYYSFNSNEPMIATSDTVPPIKYMKNIPPKPDDWALIMRELNSEYIDITKLNRSYWLQPDFYPGWNTAKGFYTQHDYSRWGVVGYGAYPANPRIIFNRSEVGSWVSDTVIFRTGYGIETWQGVKLKPEDSKYFDINLSPEQMLLSPTFPIFSKDWARLINYTITVKKKPPAGVYNISVYAVSPDKKQSKEWFWEVLKKQASPEEKEMITRAKLQADKEGKLPKKFRRWVKVGRKNKYIDSSTFSTGPTITFEIVVK